MLHADVPGQGRATCTEYGVLTPPRVGCADLKPYSLCQLIETMGRRAGEEKTFSV